MEGGNKTSDNNNSSECNICRVTGTVFLSGLTVYSFICANKAKPKSFHRAFCVLFGSSFGALGMDARITFIHLYLGVCRAFNLGFFK